MDARWYENAIIYEVELRSFADSNGDGLGDLQGLIGRLDYLARLGITALWLLPFNPSPWRDDGYDVSDYFGVHPDMGTLGDFVELVHRARDRGIRVIIDLVLNHTSDEHPWFQRARAGDPFFRDYYLWSEDKPADAEKGIVFPGVQKSTWSYDRKARRYYFHRFYDFQPDLNIANPRVRDEMAKIMGFWSQMGVSGFRLDAVPFWLEPSGAEGLNPGPNFEYLHQFREFASWRQGDFVLLGEANVERDEIGNYYGPGGLHMLFNFLLNQHLWLALARGEARPIADGTGGHRGHPGDRSVGQLPEEPRRDRPGQAVRSRTRGGVRGVRPRPGHAPVRPGDPSPARPDAGWGPAQDRDGAQPPVHTAGHARHPVRRRDRHGR